MLKLKFWKKNIFFWFVKLINDVIFCCFWVVCTYKHKKCIRLRHLDIFIHYIIRNKIYIKKKTWITVINIRSFMPFIRYRSKALLIEWMTTIYSYRQVVQLLSRQQTNIRFFFVLYNNNICSRIGVKLFI